MTQVVIIEADGGEFVESFRLRLRWCEPNIPSDGGITIRHGGSVANAYKYPADTEAALACRMGDLMVVWRDRLPANKVTFGGAAEACLPGARALFDNRFGEREDDIARRWISDSFWDVLKWTATVEGGLMVGVRRRRWETLLGPIPHQALEPLTLHIQELAGKTRTGSIRKIRTIEVLPRDAYRDIVGE